MTRMAAGVRKRNDGRLEKRFTIDGHRYSIYGHSQKELNEKEQRLRVSLSAGNNGRDSMMTMDTYVKGWLDHKRFTVKASTMRIYRSYYEPYVMPVLGERYLTEIDRQSVMDLQQSLARRLSPTTTNITITIVRTILNDAVRDRIIQFNPASDIPPIRQNQKAVDTYHRALTVEEQATFMAAAKNNFYYELLALMLLTGMRLGEVCGLFWSDIDLENQVIHVARTVTRTEDGRWCIGDSTKSKSGKRDIPINKSIRYILNSQEKKSYYAKGTENDFLVFKTPHKKLISNREVNHAIGIILNDLQKNGHGIQRFTSHALRDTFATRYIEQGGSPQTLKTILGHASLSMTMDLYSHVLPDTKQKEMDAIKIYFE